MASNTDEDIIWRHRFNFARDTLSGALQVCSQAYPSGTVLSAPGTLLNMLNNVLKKDQQDESIQKHSANPVFVERNGQPAVQSSPRQNFGANPGSSFQDFTVPSNLVTYFGMLADRELSLCRTQLTAEQMDHGIGRRDSSHNVLPKLFKLRTYHQKGEEAIQPITCWMAKQPHGDADGEDSPSSLWGRVVNAMSEIPAREV